MCGSVNGDALNYGKLDPYLNEVVMHEHCYIRGPTGCQGDAVQLYTKIGMYSARPVRRVHILSRVHFSMYIYKGVMVVFPRHQTTLIRSDVQNLVQIRWVFQNY